VNLGNLAYMQKDYRKALGSWQVAVKALDAQGKAKSVSAQMIQVNISMAYNALSDFSSARASFERAAAIDPDKVRDFAYLASVGAGSAAGGRAAELSDAVIFVRDE
jgi:tetratricopeptide (TPR) repeat protein